MTPERSKKLKRLRDDPRYYIENCLKVVCAGQLVDFKLRYAQELVIRAIEERQRQGKPIRLLILKARREGISTLIQAIIYQRITTRKHRVGMVVAHEFTSAKEIFETARRFYTQFRKPTLRPMLRSLGSKQMVFDNPNANDSKRGLDSKLVVETAIDVQAGVGTEVNYLHLSEVSKYRDAETLCRNLLQCVNIKDPDTIVVKECTAEEPSGYFYDDVQRVLNKESDYTLVFLPFFIFEDYKIDPPAGWKPKQREERVRNKYKWEEKKISLTDAQLYWRERKIEDDFKGDERGFFSQYPGSISEAFQYAGNARFNHDRLDEIESEARSPIFTGFIHEDQIKDGFKHNLEPNQNGYLTIYEKPQHQAKYVFFADVSEGIEVSDRKDGHVNTDFSCIDVLRCDTLEQVAHWHGRIVPELFCDEIIKLAMYYNEAFGTPEKNSIGYGIVASLKQKYSNLYIRAVPDKNGNSTTKEFGWRTTFKSKQQMVKDLAALINDKEIKINNPGTFEELRRFMTHSDGKIAAPEGLHDDRVISLAGAIQMWQHWYSKPEEAPEEPDDPDFEVEEDDD